MSESTSVNGAISVKWARHSTQPKTVFVEYDPVTLESVRLNFTPLLWSVGDTDFQIRLRDDRTQSWAGVQPVSVCWLAIW